MATIPIPTIRQAFNDDFASQAAVKYGETKDSIVRFLDVAVPAALAGVYSYAGRKGHAAIAGIAGEYQTSGFASRWTPETWSENLAGIQTRGAELSHTVLQDKAEPLQKSLAAHVPVKEATAAGLLPTVVAVVFGQLAPDFLETGANTNFGQALNTGHAAALAALPSGYALLPDFKPSPGGTPEIHAGSHSFVSNTAGAVEYETTIGTGGDSGSDDEVDPVTYKKHSGALAILFWLLAALLGFMAIWYFINSKKEPVVNTASAFLPTGTGQQGVVDKPASVSRHESLKVVLPDGVTIEAWKGGIEDQLVTFIKDSSAKIADDKWFDFDALNFKTGSSEITPESARQIGNIQAILKSFPKVKVKIGGYTDKTGHEAENLKLSQARAEAVLAALKSSGEASSLTGAKGYGSGFAKIPASASDDERAVDRRISLSVREK